MFKTENKTFKIENITYIFLSLIATMILYAIKATPFLEMIINLQVGGLLGIAVNKISENKVINPQIDKIEIEK